MRTGRNYEEPDRATGATPVAGSIFSGLDGDNKLERGPRSLRTLLGGDPVVSRDRPIRLILVDDQVLFCQLAREVLSGSSQFLVLAEAYSGQRAIELVQDLEPDVVLMDVEMEGINGLEATRVIRDSFPRVRVVLMSIYDDREYRRLATEAGAIAFISKPESTEGHRWTA